MVMTLILILLLGLPLGLTALSMVLFLRQSRRDGHWERLGRECGSPWRAVPRALVLGWASMVLALILLPLRFVRFSDRTAGTTPDSDPAPSVILVHGIFHNASAWLLYRPILSRAGLRHHFFLEYNSATSIFAEAEDRLAALTAKVLQARPGRQVILIGHSLGGLLARTTASRPEFAPHLAGLITLTTPHGGSILGRLGLTRLARSLHPDSALMRSLAQRLPPANLPKLAVVVPTDGLVLPNTAADPPGPGWTVRRTPPMGHIDVLYHLPTARLTAEFAARAWQGGPGQDGPESGVSCRDLI